MHAHLSNLTNRFLDSMRLALANRHASRCLLCGDPAAARALCAACWQDLPWLEAPCCRQCAHPLATPGLCGRCLAEPPHFDRVVAATRYHFPVDGLIQACKYGGRLATVRALAAMLAHAPPGRADVIVPMPLSQHRLRERGFNQALELARAAAAAAGIRVDAGLCLKTRDTTAQTRLPWKQRRKNIRGAFLVPADIAGLHVVVVDDVLTTGATLSELARTLKRAGAASVTGWVLARTVAGGGSAA